MVEIDTPFSITDEDGAFVFRRCGDINVTIDDRILLKTRDGIERGSADGDARDNEVLLEKKCWRRLDWMGETTAGVLMFVPILMSTECSADDATLVTAASDTEESAATRCSTIVVVVASQGRGCDGEVPRVVLASDAPDCNNAVVVVMF
jgi:hypothetical protein